MTHRITSVYSVDGKKRAKGVSKWEIWKEPANSNILKIKH